jgi:hypothetical protein
MAGPGNLSDYAGRSGPSSILDGPPPHPQMQAPISSAMGGAPASARQLPTEQILALMQSGSSIGEMLDTMAQLAPDIAPDFAACKELLQRALAKLMTAGGGLTPPGPMSGPVPGVTPGARMG